jgi:hypothetical protein
MPIPAPPPSMTGAARTWTTTPPLSSPAADLRARRTAMHPSCRSPERPGFFG